MRGDQRAGASRCRIRKYRSGDLEALLRVHQVSGEEALHQSWYYLENPRVDLDLVYVIEAAGEARSTARIVPLQLYVDGKVVPVGGIATVATHPAYRRRGLAGRLTRHALYELRGRGVHLSLLHPFDPAFYRRYGFELATEGLSYTLKLADLPASSEQHRVRGYSGGDLPEMMALQDEEAALHPCCVRRSESWWRLALDLSGEKAADYGHRAAVYEREGRLEGYVLYRHSEAGRDRAPRRVLHVPELLTRTPEARSGLHSFLAAHAPLASELEYEASRADPLHPFLDTALPEARAEPGFMLRLVDVEGALGLLEREIEAPLSLEVSDDTIPENRGEYTVGTTGEVLGGASSAERVALDVRQLARLYAGSVSASQLARHGLVLPGSAKALELLEALFPRADPWIFPIDSF